jgi:hypothetical protein
MSLLNGPPVGAQGLAAIFRPEGILQICLLHTAPFDVADTTDEIQDMRQNGKRYPCQNLPQLVEDLARALLDYECWLRALQDESESLQQRLLKQLASIWRQVDYFMWLRGKEKLPVHTALPHKRETVNQAFHQISGIVMAMTPDAFARMSQYSRSRCRRDLIQEMQKAFTHYGPRKYPDAAVFRTIAAILLQLGVEHGREEGKGRHEVIHTVGVRLYKFMQRTTN